MGLHQKYNKFDTSFERVSFNITKPWPFDENTSLIISLFMNIRDEINLRVNQIENTTQYESDWFVDIKTDEESIKKVIKDIKNKTIPLFNRDKIIDYEKYTYVRKSEDGPISLYVKYTM